MDRKINMTVDEAIRIAKEQCKNPYAQSYLKNISESIELGGLNGMAVDSFKLQILYALNNMKTWRGETAREVKKVLKKYTQGK